MDMYCMINENKNRDFVMLSCRGDD